MRLIYPALFIIVITVVVATFLRSDNQSEPLETASQFLKLIKEANYRDAVELFGGNACHCPKTGGWVSYLVYESAQEPNLAFLVGKSFQNSSGRLTPIKSSNESRGNLLPWQKPEDVVVDIELIFPPGSGYQPCFLPLPMAYGHEMKSKDFESFCIDPDHDAWKGFSLRLRAGLETGLVERPKESLGIEYKPSETQENDIAEKTNVYEGMEEAIIEALGPEAAGYLHPSDPGAVIDENGETVSKQELEKKLPRLTSVKLRLHIVRRGRINKWTVYHLALLEPRLQLPLDSMKEIELRSIKPPTKRK